VIVFDNVTEAVKGGANTYRQIAAKLGVRLDDPDLVAAVHWMINVHHLLAFVDDGCCTSIEHTSDCRLVVPDNLRTSSADG
jgi:hypothetical protein